MSAIVYEDVIGEPVRPGVTPISGLPIPRSLRDGLTAFFEADILLSPPQQWAVEQGVLDQSAHYLICAPTNSGKTLIAILRVFFQAIQNGDRAVYVVPLKALAEEKADEFRGLAEKIHAASGPDLKIRVSTGDYQLSDDFLGSPPPKSGEIVICTPERLEVILRNPDNQKWAGTAKTYVLDEFHLLGEENRGANMESLITRLLIQLPDSCILALSATIGEPEKVAGWLNHTGKTVHTLDSDYRYPQLRRTILETSDKDAFIIERAAKLFQTKDMSLLVFVYRKSDAEKLSRLLVDQLSNGDLISYFHSGLSLIARRDVLSRFGRGETRILIATTSLKMGINTPATEVIVRDTVFHGFGRLRISDILQMIGRAGRGNSSGRGYVLCDSSEGAINYAEDLKNGTIDPIKPQLFGFSEPAWKMKGRKENQLIDPVRTVVLGEVARQGYSRIANLEEFLQSCYSGWCEGQKSIDLNSCLASLSRDKLLYPVENSESTYAPTRLGRTVVFSGLSSESGAMLAGFLRALMRLSEKSSDVPDRQKNYLRRLSDLDLLFLAVASFEVRGQLVKAPSKKGIQETQAFIEALPIDEKPLVNLWRTSRSEKYPTRRLISSLRFQTQGDEKQSEIIFYKLLRTAILLYRHAKGESLEVLATDFGGQVYPGTLESGLKFTVTWVLSCFAQICSRDKCYKLDYLAIQALNTLQDLSIGASLGKLLTIDGVGRRSVMKLVDAGCVDLENLAKYSVEELLELGIRKKQASKISQYLRRRSR